MAPGPLATVAVLVCLHISPWLVDARSLRIATDDESKQHQPGSPAPAAPAAASPAEPVAASPTAAEPPPPDAPPQPPCPMQQPQLPVDVLVKKITTFGDDAVAGAGAQIKSAATNAKVEALGRIQTAADDINPMKNPGEPGALEAEATEPLQKVREELRSNFEKMHAKAEEEAAEVLDKVKASIHNATHATVEATVTKKEEENEEFVKENLEHAAQDINISTDLADTAMKAVQKTMKAIQEVQKSSKSLPTNEIENATHIGKRAQKTSAMFTHQSLDTKQVIEQFMELDYQSHHDVAIADGEQSDGTEIAGDAEKQASTNFADITVLQASISEAKEEATQALQKTSDLGSRILGDS